MVKFAFLKSMTINMGLLGFKLKLGMFPKTEKIDRKHEALVREYEEYLAYSQSEELARFGYLNKYLHSPEFEERENNPEISKDETKELKNEFKRLKKSPQLVAYLKSKSQEAKFAPLKAWNLVFEDDFTGDSLDTDKWLTRHYWGDKLLNGNYSFSGDQHCNTDGKNISLSKSKLSIITRKEEAQGFEWKPEAGFIHHNFPYTSGVINTGKSFWQMYGKVEVKVKIPKGAAYHAFWLAGERMLPQINVFKYSKKKFYLGNFWENTDSPYTVKEDQSEITGAFTGKYYIFSLEWAPKFLQWSINGKIFKIANRGIPSEPMYLVFGSGMTNDAYRLSNPVKFEIDWVRFYVKP